MGMTMTQKILAAHAGLESVEAGQFIESGLDMVLGNDITAPIAIEEFRRMGATQVFDRDKVALVPDHFSPNKDIKAAEQCKCLREFSRQQEITNYFELGKMGVEHALLPEQGLVSPGDCIIGADSHTCTYGALGAFSTGVGSTDMAAAMATGKAWFKVPAAIRFHLTGSFAPWVGGKDLILYLIGMLGVDGALYKSMEFQGPGVAALTMDDRFTVANMAIECGAKNGIFPVDEQTLAYLKNRAKRPGTVYEADADAEYAQSLDIDLGDIPLTVAFPHLPENTRPVEHSGNVPINQVVIGSCTNGRYSDLEIAARLFKGRKVDRRVRAIIIPATQQIYLEAMKAGLLETFIESGCAVSTPTCGPCLGGHMGILAAGERAVATTNRNFVGRMGHPTSEVYLAGPAVAAASAILGRIASPQELEG